MKVLAVSMVLLMVVTHSRAASLSDRRELDDDPPTEDFDDQEENNPISDDLPKTLLDWAKGGIYDNNLVEKRYPVNLPSGSGDVYLTLLRPLPKKWRQGRPLFVSVTKEKPSVSAGSMRGSSSVNYASFEPFVEPIRVDNLEIFGERHGPFSSRRMTMH